MIAVANRVLLGDETGGDVPERVAEDVGVAGDGAGVAAQPTFHRTTCKTKETTT